MKRVIIFLMVIGLSFISCKSDKTAKNEATTYTDTLAQNDTTEDLPFIFEEENVDTVTIYTEDTTTGEPQPVKEVNIKEDQKIYVIVGSFKNFENAQKKLASLKKLGYDAQILPKVGEYHRVAVAGYETEKEAREALKKFRSKFKDKSIWLLLR